MSTSTDHTLTERELSATAATCAPVPQLFVVLRCDDLAAPPSRHSLSNIDEVWIGRGDERSATRVVEGGVRQLRLHIDDKRLSRRHARLRRTAAGWELEDLDSSNGTRVDGAAVRCTTLGDGALLQVGHTCLSLRGALPTPANALGDLRADALHDRPPALRTLLPELGAAFERLERVARSLVPVVLLGETGTGKELLARAVHDLSQRTGAFVAINCGALPESLVESQLFGHVRGAFSGANRDEAGYVRAADRGSLFLDEIGDLPASSQTALLRVLQEGEVVPVGSTRPLRVDLRVLSATHAPLIERAERGEFRNDLFARLSGFVFRLTALRDRREDLGLLVRALLPELERAGAAPGAVRIQPELARALWQHGWPRNIRELQQTLSAAVVLSESRVIGLEHVALADPRNAAAPSGAAPERELEQQLRLRFAEHRGNVTQVAKAMGKARVQVQRWMKRFGIDPSQFR